MITFLKKKVKTLNHGDIGLVKLSVVALTIFVLMIWPAAMTWVRSINHWWFLAAAVLFGARPFYKHYMK